MKKIYIVKQDDDILAIFDNKRAALDQLHQELLRKAFLIDKELEGFKDKLKYYYENGHLPKGGEGILGGRKEEEMGNSEILKVDRSKPLTFDEGFDILQKQRDYLNNTAYPNYSLEEEVIFSSYDEKREADYEHFEKLVEEHERQQQESDLSPEEDERQRNIAIFRRFNLSDEEIAEIMEEDVSVIKENKDDKE